jgi:hypothetical protein
MRFLAVDPDKIPLFDWVDSPRDTHKTLASNAVNELVSWKVIAFYVMILPPHKMPCAGHGVKNLLVPSMGSGEKGEDEASFEGCHIRIGYYNLKGSPLHSIQADFGHHCSYEIADFCHSAASGRRWNIARR